MIYGGIDALFIIIMEIKRLTAEEEIVLTNGKTSFGDEINKNKTLNAL